MSILLNEASDVAILIFIKYCIHKCMMNCEKERVKLYNTITTLYELVINNVQDLFEMMHYLYHII